MFCYHKQNKAASRLRPIKRSEIDVKEDTIYHNEPEKINVVVMVITLTIKTVKVKIDPSNNILKRLVQTNEKFN